MGQRRRWYTPGLIVAALFVWASAAAGASQRAHVHGVGRINIVVEGQQATVAFLAPAESLYGFEHQARTPADQEKRDAALARLQEKISTMVVFEADHREQFLTLLFESCARTGATLIFVSHDRGLMPLFDQSIALTEINTIRLAPTL